MWSKMEFANSKMFLQTVAVVAELPSIPTLKRNIQRIRQKEKAAPPYPNNFDFIIPEQNKKTCNGELFLHFDSINY